MQGKENGKKQVGRRSFPGDGGERKKGESSLTIPKTNESKSHLMDIRNMKLGNGREGPVRGCIGSVQQYKVGGDTPDLRGVAWTARKEADEIPPL